MSLWDRMWRDPETARAVVQVAASRAQRRAQQQKERREQRRGQRAWERAQRGTPMD